VHEETVRRWLRDGRLPGRALGGWAGDRIRESDLIALSIKDQKEKRPRPGHSGRG